MKLRPLYGTSYDISNVFDIEIPILKNRINLWKSDPTRPQILTLNDIEWLIETLERFDPRMAQDK